ncbi:MAG: sulfatase-like hydrolase/transferase [Verrucomicrobiota bacterium]
MKLTLLLVLLSASLSLVPFASTAMAAEKPNIILIVVDDLGWNDVDHHNPELHTPNIDKLAKENVELDRFYVTPQCSPTRAGLLTGRYPHRFGMLDFVISPDRDSGMPESEYTIAEMLGDAGYEHRAMMGKWRLGLRSNIFHPLNHGFTEFYGHYNGAIDYFSRVRAKEPDWHRNYESVKEEGNATDLLTDEAIRFVEEKSASKVPPEAGELFNIKNDAEEKNDLSDQLADKVRKLADLVEDFKELKGAPFKSKYKGPWSPKNWTLPDAP